MGRRRQRERKDRERLARAAEYQRKRAAIRAGEEYSVTGCWPYVGQVFLQAGPDGGPGWFERMQPGAAAASIRAAANGGPPIICRSCRREKLGTTADGTLTLDEWRDGVYYECVIDASNPWGASMKPANALVDAAGRVTWERLAAATPGPDAKCLLVAKWVRRGGRRPRARALCGSAVVDPRFGVLDPEAATCPRCRAKLLEPHVWPSDEPEGGER